MTITGNLRAKQPFLGIEEVPNNDSLFWGEKKIHRVILLQKSDKNTSKTSLKQKKRGAYLCSDRHLNFSA
jgi:hypothetical protein